jgi:hypothetical protein
MLKSKIMCIGNISSIIVRNQAVLQKCNNSLFRFLISYLRLRRVTRYIKYSNTKISNIRSKINFYNFKNKFDVLMKL